MKFLFKYPSRGRKDLFRSNLLEWVDYLSGKHDVRFVISGDADDPDMNCPETLAWVQELSKCLNIEMWLNPGKQTKISACNANVSGEWETLILMSDDMSPIVHGYDDIIATEMLEHYPDLSGALWHNDGTWGSDKICTLSIMGRKLYETLGREIYWHEYQTLWCDTEFQAVCMAMGKITYFPRTIIRHDWIRKTGVDATHRRNSSAGSIDHDRMLFEKRHKAGFPR